MQGKGLIIAVATVLILVSLYALSFSFFANNVEGAAEAHAKNLAENMNFESSSDQKAFVRKTSKAYLDSMETESVVPLLGTTYKTCKERKLNLGLDLQGGMSVVLQVALEGAIKSLSGDSRDPDFGKALERAKVMETTGEDDFITLFERAFSELAPGKSLASVFATQENQQFINNKSSDSEVVQFIRDQSSNAIETTFEIIRTRIDKFGVANPNISLQKESGRILVELPGIDDVQRMRDLLQTEANLEFWEVREVNAEMGTWWTNINKAVQDHKGIDPSDSALDVAEKVDDSAAAETFTVDLNGDTTFVADSDLGNELGDDASASASDTTDVDEFKRKNPFYAVFSPLGQGGAPFCGQVRARDRDKLKEYLALDKVKDALPRNIKLLIAKKPSGETEEGEGVYNVYAIEGRGSDMKPPIDGGVITNATSNQQMDGSIDISMSMNSQGAQEWARLTKKNIQQNVAIVLDDQVVSAPTVQAEIKGGRSSITGDFDIIEGQDLANILKIGKLPAPAKIVEESVVGPTLGAASIKAGIWSLIGGLAMVLAFMAFYYNKGGIVSILALLLNMFFIIGVLTSLGASLTLPGIAGIVLTIGMAVDANVIIYERIREELAKGSSRKKAIYDGFKYSYSAIIDANVTTLITAVILAYFGLGPVLGFATILIIGIFTSLFTAVLMTRLFVDWAEERGIAMTFISGGAERFKNMGIDFVTKRKMNYVASAIFIFLGVGSMVTQGFQLGVDFEGGRNYVLQLDQDIPTEKIAAALGASDAFGTAPTVTTYGGVNQVKLTTNYEVNNPDKEVSAKIETILHSKLSPLYATAPSKADFISDNIMSSQNVGPTIADDITRGAVWATIYALIGIFLYIMIRFRKWQFGTAAVLTVLHDTLILLSIFSIFHKIMPFGMEINQAFIAALLTVIGYSINDTVVVFDRIREYLGVSIGRKYLDVVNEAINSTLSRTVITSLTTLFVITMLFIFGGATIRGFAFALMIGVIVGTYSSIFIATPLVIDLQGAKADTLVEAPPRVNRPQPATV